MREGIETDQGKEVHVRQGVQESLSIWAEIWLEQEDMRASLADIWGGAFQEALLEEVTASTEPCSCAPHN